MSVRLYVKLPKAQLEKEGVEKMFSDFEDSFTTKLIRERRRKECRGFGFVTVSTDESADSFISKYNGVPFVYEGESFKDEEGNQFTLVIEKALPRTKKEEEEEENSNSEPSEKPTIVKVNVNKDTPRPTKNTNKTRKPPKSKSSSNSNNKSVSVSESIQPDPRWANELNKLKEMFTAQANK